MRISYVLLLITAGLALSCASHTRTAAVPAVVPHSMMERQIQNAIYAGDGDYQLRALRERLAAEPDNLNLRLEVAGAYLTRGYPDVALEHCRLAAARFPESAPAQLALAKTLRSLNQRKQAADGLETFLKKHPESGAEYYSWLGILRDEMGLWPAGEPAHRAAVERAPNSDTYRNNLGYNLLKQGKSDAAADEFTAALKLSPGNVVARNNLGLALASTGKAEQAIKNWQSGTDLATAHSNLAAVLIERGQYAEARKEIEIALGYNRAHTAALRNLEIVSRLEGTPATMPAQSTETRWEKWKTSVRRLFVGPLDTPVDTQKPAATTARLR